MDVRPQPNGLWLGVLILEESYFPSIHTGCLSNIADAVTARSLMEAGYKNILASFDAEEARKAAVDDDVEDLVKRLAQRTVRFA
jgi:hypothetical protein